MDIKYWTENLYFRLAAKTKSDPFNGGGVRVTCLSRDHNPNSWHCQKVFIYPYIHFHKKHLSSVGDDFAICSIDLYFLTLREPMQLMDRQSFCAI